MHLNFYFLKQLSSKLAKILIDFELIECFSQNKDELIFSFLKDQEEFHLKAVLNRAFTCISFPAEFARARKNSVNLMPEIINRRVIQVKQYVNERCFSLIFEDDYFLLFKMHGQRSNIILYHNNSQVSLFNNQMKFDIGLEIVNLDRHIPQNKEFYLENGLQTTFPTFDKYIHSHLAQLNFEREGINQWEILERVIEQLTDGNIYIYQIAENPPQLSLLKPLDSSAEILFETNDPISASNDFFHQYTRVFHLKNEKDNVLRILTKSIKKGNNYITKNYDKVEDIEKNARLQEIADILMANLHVIPTGAKEVKLFDFYRNNEISIKLKKDLSPQKNAETYYRKAKNQKVEIEKIIENIEKKESEIARIENQVQEIEAIHSIKEFKKLLKKEQLTNKQNDKDRSLFNKVEISPWVIYVGRNASNNDLLTQKYAYKNDLWLHAKDVSGSHVIVKYIAGKEFSKDIIEKAASLAAFYSKRKNDTLCPVIFTPKKYVRKPKGFLPGQVIVDREDIILVEPKAIDKIHQSS